jgi:hypothetical protein
MLHDLPQFLPEIPGLKVKLSLNVHYILFHSSSSKTVLPLYTATYIADETSSKFCFIPNVVRISKTSFDEGRNINTRQELNIGGSGNLLLKYI